ncbi:hypothetical protein C8R48DRAFT_697085 [Suillus tomentosus]|nr:hypothetical protein C8R48DRAFT_697085 [Suillus tomentosus]
MYSCIQDVSPQCSTLVNDHGSLDSLDWPCPRILIKSPSKDIVFEFSPGDMLSFCSLGRS